MNETTWRWFMPWHWRWWAWAIVILIGLVALPISLLAFNVCQQQIIQERHHRTRMQNERTREDLRRLGVSLHNGEGPPEQPDPPADALEAQPGAN